MDGRLSSAEHTPEADADSPVATAARRKVIVAGIAALIVGSAAAGLLVTSVAPDPTKEAARSVVELTTTLESGATVVGTGVILRSSGEVVTTYTVVAGAVSIAADVTGNGARYAASTFALSPAADVAVLQLLNATGLPRASIGTSSSVARGDRVTAITTAPGVEGTSTSTQGAVTALGQTVLASDSSGADPATLSGLIEFDAPLPRDGAGGALVDASGKLVGLDATTDPMQRASATPGAGFAIPIDQVLGLVHDVETHTPNPEILEGHGAYLGIHALDSATPPGALIVEADPGAPAAVAGMAAEDVILSIDGVRIDSVAELRVQLGQHQGGDRVVVGWIDAHGDRHSASVQLAAATFT